MTPSTGKRPFAYLRSRPFPERVWGRVDKNGPNGCWLWLGGKRRLGYGFVWDGQRQVAAYRAVYELVVGPIPEGLSLDHLCRNPSCVNPAHLEPVTHHENVLRGESFSARQARQTHCKRGHPFTPENTYVQPKGSRTCKTCARERQITARELTRTGAQVDSSVIRDRP